MLKLSLTALAREPAELNEQVPPNHEMWEGFEVDFQEPVDVALKATSVGEGVWVKGDWATTISAACRRCLTPLSVDVGGDIEVLFESMTPDELDDVEGDVYPLPDRGDELDMIPAIREQVLMKLPEYVVCSDECRGICAHCGADLNKTDCGCEPEVRANPWEALKKLKFD